MAIDKICGIETEYGILARGMDITPMLASSLLVNAYSDHGLTLRAWDFADEHPDNDARLGWNPEADYPEVEVLMANSVLTNGARFYVDHAHPEVSTPECRSIRDAVLYDRAGEEVMRRALARANQRLPRGASLRLYKNNSDGKGNSYGCHENYLVDRAAPFGRLASQVTAHFVSRQVFTGAGKVGVENPRDGEVRVPYQLSQRADFFEEPVGLETTVRRPIVNTRDEPHCDPVRWRRLHVIAGDANMSETATFLKLGTTALVLCMIEDDVFPAHLVVDDPVTQIRLVSHDPTLTHRVPLADGTSITALEMQRQLLAAARAWFDSTGQERLGGDTQAVLDCWAEVLDALGDEPNRLADRIDWIAKRRLITAMTQREDLHADHPKLKMIDLQYHDIDSERSLFTRLGMRTLCEPGDVDTAVDEPPVDTRAWFRGRCLTRWPGAVSSANWDSMVFDIGTAQLQKVAMMDPTKGTRALTAALFDQAVDVADFLERLGSAVEQVVEDPGW